MPYRQYKCNGRFCLKNIKTGKVTRFKTAEDRAEGIRIREAFAHGWKPSNKTVVRAHNRKGTKGVKKHCRVIKATYRLPIVQESRKEWTSEKDPFLDLYDRDYPIVVRKKGWGWDDSERALEDAKKLQEQSLELRRQYEQEADWLKIDLDNHNIESQSELDSRQAKLEKLAEEIAIKEEAIQESLELADL
jgi:hypothetical protein